MVLLVCTKRDHILCVSVCVCAGEQDTEKEKEKVRERCVRMRMRERVAKERERAGVCVCALFCAFRMNLICSIKVRDVQANLKARLLETLITTHTHTHWQLITF